MSQINVTNQVLPPAPPCVNWCRGHDPWHQDNPRDGWDTVERWGVYKVCRVALLDDDTGEQEVEVQAWSSLRWPHDDTSGPTRSYPVDGLRVDVLDLVSTRVEIYEDEVRSPDELERLARALSRAAAMIRNTTLDFEHPERQAATNAGVQLVRGQGDRTD